MGRFYGQRVEKQQEKHKQRLDQEAKHALTPRGAPLDRHWRVEGSGYNVGGIRGGWRESRPHGQPTPPSGTKHGSAMTDGRCCRRVKAGRGRLCFSSQYTLHCTIRRQTKGHVARCTAKPLKSVWEYNRCKRRSVRMASGWRGWGALGEGKGGIGGMTVGTPWFCCVQALTTFSCTEMIVCTKLETCMII